MIMPGRKFNAGEYRFGFNEKENDNELSGVGNWQDYGMRPYNPRIGRPPCVDPIAKEYPELSPYQFFSNNPILNIDIDGLEGEAYKTPTQTAKLTNNGYNLAIDNARAGYIPELYLERDKHRAKPLPIVQKTTTFKTGKTNYERQWDKSVPGWSREWIKNDPVPKAVGTGFAASAAILSGIEVAPLMLKYGAQATKLINSGLTGASIKASIGIGVATGAAEYYGELPQDAIPILPNPVSEATRRATNASLIVIEEVFKQTSSSTNNKKEEKKEIDK